MQSIHHHESFPSWWTMLLTDVFLLSLAFAGTAVVVLKWRTLKEAGAVLGVVLILAGLWVGVALYAADLFTMTVLPTMVGEDRAMTAMVLVHERYSWYVNSAAAVLILVGLTLTVMQVVRQFAAVRDHARASEHSEARFRHFATVASDWFWETDENLRFTYFSERNREITGFDPSIYLGKTRHEITPENTMSEKWRRHLDDLDHRRPFRTFQYELTRADGSPLVISINGEPVFDCENRFVGYRGTGTDVTEQRKAEEARDAALRIAEEANQAKSEFLATMSHDLRTPLNAIVGFSSILNEELFGPLGERYRDYARDIRDSGDHLLSLVNDILDLSAIEAGKVAIEKHHLDAGEIVSECQTVIRPRAQSAGVDVALGLPEVPATVYADRQALKQILLNLLANAVEFTPPGGRVTLSADCKNGSVAFVVADTGQGISEERLTTLMEPFVRGEKHPYHAGEGWGLGLAIVKSLVDRLDGSLEVESRVGQGTTVTVSMPISNGAERPERRTQHN